MTEFGLTDNDAKLFIYRAFLEREIRGVPRHLMPAVHENYFEPEIDAFKPRNLWSLSNAFTSAFKKLAPIKQFEVTARLGAFLTAERRELIRVVDKPNLRVAEMAEFRETAKEEYEYSEAA